MYDYIFLLGAQGSGKTTIARILKEKLNAPHVDFDWIRGYHLNKNWSNTSKEEENMSLENLLLIIRNYKKHNYYNVLVSGFTHEEIKEVIQEVKDDNYIVITLFLTDEEELKNRVLTESRDSGFRDYEASITYNKKLRDELSFPHEYKIGNAFKDPEKTADQIMTILEKAS